MKRSGFQPFGASHRGVGMIEVLVALLVIAVGVLGYAGMQLFALKGAEEANSRTHATLIARDALERLLINPGGSATYFGNNWPSSPVASGSARPSGCVGSTASCNAAQLASADIALLSWIAAHTLPNGMVAARTNCTGASTSSCVVVSWGSDTTTSCLTGNAISLDGSCVVLEARRP